MLLPSIVKTKTSGNLRINRKTLYKDQELFVCHESCVGCKICEKICPQKAIYRVVPHVYNKGRIIRKAIIDIDENKCTFCGECVIFCPLNAITIESEGISEIPITNTEMFPSIAKSIRVETENCQSDCKAMCQTACPKQAIKVIVGNPEAPNRDKILCVKVEESDCMFCRRCEYACPTNAIQVKKPFDGIIQLNSALCQDNCRICADLCPSKAIWVDNDGKVKLEDQFCIFCGVCQEVCPTKAIDIKRTQIFHTNGTYGAWIRAAENLVAHASIAKDVNSSSLRKMNMLVEKIIHK